ncbi:MAG TPA: aspartate kinase [Gaiellaceae bacterium]|nr:aspartate kinase [Gaiellaceae bacterium]
MALVVQKFGGTSVGDPQKLTAVARRLVAAREAGSQVVGVLSAMGRVTDELLALSHEVSPLPEPRELDMLLSVGERISCALAAMAINDLGHKAISLTGSQAGIVTDTTHGKAKIVDIRAHRIHEALEADQIVLVAGFQGVSTDFEVTTLGRGGSDLTAVALAAALDADVCEIFTDVEGVFTADPRIVPEARKLTHVSYEEMLELSASGGKVLMLRSVEFARSHGVRIHVRSSFSDTEGTLVTSQEELMEQPIISGIAHDTSEAEITILGVPDRPGIAAAVFRKLADETVNVDMIVQNVSAEGHTDISFTVPKSELLRIDPVIQAVAAEVGARGVQQDSEIAKISLIGAGMKSNPGVAADMFDALAEAGINIGIISTSSIRISCVVPAGEVERAVRVVHDKFRLSESVVLAEEG